MAFYLGVDGGNTKTVALVAGGDGVIVGCGRAGGSDIYGAASVAAALAELGAAVAAALAKAEIGPERLRCAAFSMAGADWPEDFDLLRAAFRERGYGADPVVVNDAIGALRAGSPDGTGVALAAGTGMAVGARAGDGREWHSGHWPTAGGGSGLGKAALDAVFRAHLGVAPATSLAARVVAFFGAASVEDVLYRITRRGARWGWQDAARLAPLALDEAERGDPVAASIVHDFGRALGLHAVAAARRVGLGPDPFPLVLTGGVFRHPSRRYVEALLEPVQAAFPGVAPTFSRLEPAAGALLLALEAGGDAVTPEVVASVAATMPAPALFATGGERAPPI